ncbi:FAD-binding oxidoreductase [Acidisoma cellulosilytica]|uniref:FAD-binding oxidoreductase n=2 Tax=Acidisoma cellulosilyticum TaxID=2802395 RepID=A0A963Z5E7_9PROT|nr:FAD-binding oxidoreductase [Acidisoma cellulosilyticum]
MDAPVSGADVVVIGAGATGLSTGWWLAQSGVNVVVIDSGLVGWGASGRNGGGCSHHFSPLFVEEQRLWPQMDELLGYPTEFCPKRVRLAFDERQLELYGAAVRNAAHQGFSSTLLDAKQAQELVPLAGDGVVGGYFYDFGGHANPHRTVQAYAWAMQDHGGRVLQETKVTGFRQQGGRIAAVITDHGAIDCDQVVLAAGPSTQRLAAMVGVSVPMVPARAEMLVTEPLPLMPIGGVDGNGLYGRQTLRGNLAYGGGPHEWLEDEAVSTTPSSTPLMSYMAGRLAQLFPRAAHARIIRSWAGVIENTPDGRPVIDRPAEPGNLTVATLSSIGFGLSPATGRAIAQIVTEGRCDFADLSSFSLARFADLEPDWAHIQGWREAAQA